MMTWALLDGLDDVIGAGLSRGVLGRGKLEDNDETIPEM